MKVYMLTKAKKVICEEVSASQRFYIFNRGLYPLDSSSIKLSYKINKNKINPVAEIFFVEGNPTPIAASSTVGMDRLDSIIYSNHLKSIAHIEEPGHLMNALHKVWNSLVTPKTLSVIVIVLMGAYLIYLYTRGQLRF